MNIFKCVLLLISLGLVSCYTHKEKPDDFDTFWEASLEELGTTIKSEVVRDSISDRKRWTLYKIESFQSNHFYAWVSEPLDSLKHPIKIKFSEFGRGTTSVNRIPHAWFLKDENSISMVVDIRGQGMSTDQIEFKGYLTKGLKERNNYIYRGAFLDAVRSVDFIERHPKSDGNVIVYGNQQGGALAIVATALNTEVTMSVIGFPFLTDIYRYDRQKWPMKVFLRESNKKDIDLDDLLHTLSYFDMINFADKIKTPLFLKTQEMDTITPKEGAIKFFNRIPGALKEIHMDDCKGHGCSKRSEEANKFESAFIKKHMLKD